MKVPVKDVSYKSKVCAKVLSRLWSCSGQVSVSRIPIETRRTTKDDEEKKTSKRVSRVPLRDLRGKKFQGFLSGTSGEKKIKNKTGTYHWEKHIACFMHICNVRSQVFFPGVWVCLRDFIFILFFFAALSASLHCGKTLGPEKSFEYGKVFEEYGWETRTFEEGKKKAPLIQGGGLRQAHTIEKVENPSSRLLIRGVTIRHPLIFKVPN